MTLRRNDARDTGHDTGFTLVEVMIVVIVIGILAAIAIPVFLNQRQAAADATVQADLSAIAIAAESYAAANHGTYSGMAISGNSVAANNLRGASGYSLKTSPGNLFKLGTVTTSSYIVTAYNSANGNSHTFTLTLGSIAGPASGSTITVSD